MQRFYGEPLPLNDLSIESCISEAQKICIDYSAESLFKVKAAHMQEITKSTSHVLVVIYLARSSLASFS